MNIPKASLAIACIGIILISLTLVGASDARIDRGSVVGFGSLMKAGGIPPRIVPIMGLTGPLKASQSGLKVCLAKP